MREKTNVGEFDDAMCRIKAISDATSDEFAALHEKAKQMGMTTKFTALDIAEAFESMALAGWDTEEMISNIEDVMNFAALRAALPGGGLL